MSETTPQGGLAAIKCGACEVKDYQESCQHKASAIENICSELRAHLSFPWIALPDKTGITALLLSRDKEKSVQRRASFAFNGRVDISVHRRPMSGTHLRSMSLPEQIQPIDVTDELSCKTFVQHVISVIRKLQSYEVCVGVNDAEFTPLWTNDKLGEIDNNPYGEQRYEKTFRPFTCHLLVSTEGYLRRRCSVCIKTKIRFRVKLKRHLTETANPSTANIHLDRSQLLNKVTIQQKKLKHSRAQLARVKAEFQHVLSKNGLNIDQCVSEDLLKICMAYTKWEV